MRALLPAIAACLVLGSCAERRNYPLMSFQDPTEGLTGLELGSVALLESGLMVAISEKDSGSIYEVAPHRETGSTLRPGGSDFVDLVRWTDPSQDCGADDSKTARRCRDDNYRARVDMEPQPIQWLSGADGATTPPAFIEDLAPFPCDTYGPCPDRVLGVTEFSTIGRLSGYRADKVAKGRDETERLFVLERGDGQWNEVEAPHIKHLQQQLSIWGRANCDKDFIVEGLAFDPATRTVFFGINRCLGPAQTVLAYPLMLVERGNGAAALSVVSSGIEDDHGNPVDGKSEGISSLDWAHGRLWATSSWDDYGHKSEPIYGGRLLVREDDHMLALPIGDVLHDRADALAILPAEIPEDLADKPAHQLLPWVKALVLFDNDFAAERSSKPNGTVIRASTPAPPNGDRTALLEFGPSPFGDQALGLNGLDFEWYWRDHRLGLISVVADRGTAGPGAWTAQLGGLWQVRLGAIGSATSSMPLFKKSVGHNRQSADVTDYAPANELEFTGYRAVVSVVPRAPNGDDVSVASLLDETRDYFETTARLPEAASDEAGLVLQGFTIDSSPRAGGGICVSALDFSLDWIESPLEEHREAVKIRTAMLGGVCNDFNAQNAEEHHGLTTDASSGVRVTLYFAVVEGAPAQGGSVTVAQDHRPEMDNHESKANLACFDVDADAGPTTSDEWWIRPDGELPGPNGTNRGGSLRGFAWAFDLEGFEDDADPSKHADVTELMALNQNVYLYRYQLRTWTGPEPKIHVEGGLSHSLHVGALPTAMLLRTDLTWWDDLSESPERWTAAGYGKRALDPNVLPEDGYLRWARMRPLEEVQCLPR